MVRRRRREHLSFFSGRRGRRRELLLMESRPSRGIARAIGVVLSGVALLGGLWWFLSSAGDEGGPEVAQLGDEAITTTTAPSLLVATTSSTTIPVITPGFSDVLCEEVADQWSIFQGTVQRGGCITARRSISEPVILWRADVGVQGWLNNPVIGEGRVYVGSAGLSQFEPDDLDGVYAVDHDTGETVWHFRTELDVNGVAYSDGVVVATGDEGRVWGLDASSGQPLWTFAGDTAIFGNPLPIEGIVVVGDGSGFATALDLKTGERRWRWQVRGPIRGGPASDGRLIFVAGEEGEAAAITVDGVVLWRAPDLPGTEIEPTTARIFSPPTVVGDLLILGLVRDDLYADPALIALDTGSGDVVWRARDAAQLKEEWGNVRGSPAVIGGLLVFGEAYSSHLMGVDVGSGETRWGVETGAFCFPHWPSPAIVNGSVILARHDGALYSVDPSTGELEWSIYIGDVRLSGEFPNSYDEEFCEWQPNTGFSILASPAVDGDGKIIVGTSEGFLIAVGDASW